MISRAAFEQKEVSRLETWYDMFASKKNIKKGSTFSLELEGNGAIIIWRPRFVVYEYVQNGKKIVLSPHSSKFLSCVEAALAGVLRWDSDAFPNEPLIICGKKGRVAVDIRDIKGKRYDPKTQICGDDFAAKCYRDSNVAIYLGKKDKAIVWDAFFWKRHKKLRIKISLSCVNEGFSRALSRTVEHEFGHVLGLFDAYGYARKPDPEDGLYHYGGHPWPDFALPPALIDGKMLLCNSVMVCNYSAYSYSSRNCSNNDNNINDCCFTRTILDYEMIFLAWRDNRLQLYTDSILGKRSKAFHNIVGE